MSFWWRRIGVVYWIIAVCFAPTHTESMVSAQEIVSRILGGQVTSDYEAVGIVGSTSDGGFCTGTLISPTHVLTAAHCAEFIFGDTEGTFEVNERTYSTVAVSIHPDFNSDSLANDIAILQLSEPVVDVAPAEIFRGTPIVGDLLFIVGFGATGTASEGSDATFGTKREGLTTIDEVTEDLITWVFDDAAEANTAPGDSGGPGFLYVDGQPLVASITSGGSEVDAILGDVAFNTRVDAFAAWIDVTLLASAPVDPDGEPTDESPSEEPTEDGNNGCENYFAEAFPFLNFLIDFLTQFLEYLSTDTAVPTTPEPTPETESPVGSTTPADQEAPDAMETPSTETPTVPDEMEGPDDVLLPAGIPTFNRVDRSPHDLPNTGYRDRGQRFGRRR